MHPQQKHELTITKFIRGKPEAFYDLGVGPKTEWRTLARKYPDMRVFGCEPHLEQYAKLLAAKFPGPLAQVAISNVEGIVTLHYATDDLKVASIFPIPYANATCEVKAWSLDRFDANMGRSDRILLWIDIEGSELAALQSGPRLLASGRVRWINVEERRAGHCPAEGWCDPRELQRFLVDYGYVRIADYNRHPTHQDAIYVHKDEK